MQQFHPCARGKWIEAFHYNLPSFTNVAPHFGARDALVFFTSEPIKANPQLQPVCGLNMTSLFASISWRLDSPGSIALTIHLHRRLVLEAFGSTNPRPPTFFFMHHSFQLTPVWVSCSFSNHT